MIAIVESIKQELRAPYEAVCQELDVPYSSLMRWRNHQQDGKAVVGQPGPAKTKPLDLDALKKKIRKLRFGRERTAGTGELYEQHRERISRRYLHALVEAVHCELRREDAALARRIECLIPGAVWSMDDLKRHWLRNDEFGHLHLVMDLASRYALRALGDEVLASGERVAMSLADLFRRHGAPLFIKMDMGSNFKHHAVRHTLAEHWVIPLLSPPHYPPYNGGVEREHQEMLRHLAARIGDGTVNPRELRLECEVSGHEVNHTRRPVLGGRTPCQVFGGRRLAGRFGRRERKEAFDEITTLAVDIAERLDEHTVAAAETAFRYAAETWMQSNNMISVTRNGEVLPSFYRFQSH